MKHQSEPAENDQNREPDNFWGAARVYDICVITAANEYQAQGYQEQLKWRINKGYLPEEIKAILSKISHLIHDAKLLGVGGGGFLFMATQGVEQTQQIRGILEERPPNDRARFFDFDIEQDGLKVSVL